MTVFNIGQGNGIIFETDKHIWVVDFGETGHPTQFNSDVFDENSVWKQAFDILKQQKRLDDHISRKPLIIMISHPDTDHYNKIHELFEEEDYEGRIKFWIYSNPYDIECFLVNYDNFKKLGINEKRIFINDHFIFSQTKDQTIFFINNPNFHPDYKNENSLMLRVQIKDEIILLTGDATMDTYELHMKFLQEIKNGPKRLEKYNQKKESEKAIDEFEISEEEPSFEESDKMVVSEEIDPTTKPLHNLPN